MLSSNRHSIEFLRGPLDGHIIELDPPLDSLVYVESIKLASHWFARLMGFLGAGDARSSFVVAIYELHADDEKFWYSYVVSTIATRRQLKRGEVWVLMASSPTRFNPHSLDLRTGYRDDLY